MLIRSAFLLVHTMSSCDYPLTGDDGASAGVAVAVVEADLPGPPAQRGLHSPDYPGQLRSCPTLYTEIHSSKKELDCSERAAASGIIPSVCHRCAAFSEELFRNYRAWCLVQSQAKVCSPKHCRAITFPVIQLPLNENKLGN